VQESFKFGHPEIRVGKNKAAGKRLRRPRAAASLASAARIFSGYLLYCVGDTQPIVEFTFRDKRH
jgi:hypothetical protein